MLALCSVLNKHSRSENQVIYGVIDQRLVSVFLGSESPCHIYTAFHDAAALVVETQNRRHTVPTSAALQRGGKFFAMHNSRTPITTFI